MLLVTPTCWCFCWSTLQTCHVNGSGYIPIHLVAAQFDAHVLSSLPAFHSLTGCDTTSFLAGHTKKSCWNVYNENHHLLSNLGKGDLNDQTCAAAAAFICKVYKVHATISVDSARSTLFAQAHLLETLPPTHDALSFHIKQSHYQASVWRQADKQRPELPPSETMGWTIQSGALVPTLISMPSLSESCIELFTCKCTTKCRRGNCNCRRKRVPCTSACICSASRRLQK